MLCLTHGRVDKIQDGVEILITTNLAAFDRARHGWKDEDGLG